MTGRRKRHGCAALVVVIVATTTGCIRSLPPNPDPGDRRLHRLESEPMVRTLPPGAALVGARSSPAHYRDDGPFGGAGWDGPSYVKTFTDSQLTDEVFAFFAKVAARSGWHVDQYNSRNWPIHARGLPYQWSRSYADGRRAVVSLLPTNRWERRSDRYTLTASVD
jgi:hypothetical protein